MSGYEHLGKELSVMEVDDNFNVTLSDLSMWMIKAGDTSKTACWYPSQRVIVKKNESDIYPFKLVNLDTFNDEAEASLF